MERLHNAVDTLLDEMCEGLLKPKYVRKAANACDTTLSRSDADEIMQKIVSVFRAKCEERIAELVQDTNIEQKLADLEILAESCEARNKELGVTDGYRPLDPKLDMEGILHPVASCYHTTLSGANERMQNAIKGARESLEQATAKVNELAQKAEEIMDNNR